MMGFDKLRGNSSSSMAETQADLIAERTPSTPERLEEDMTLPGLQKIHLMSESEMIEFFTIVLKSRTFVREIDLTLGKDYEYTEEQSRVPNSNLMHTMEFGKVARVLTMALATSPKVIGFRAVIETDKEGNISSRLFTKVAKKVPKGPVWDDETGELVAKGDPEFQPKLRVVYRPNNA